MHKFNTQVSLFNQNGVVIEEDGQNHQVKDILLDGESFFSQLFPRSLVLLLCKNQYESVFFYINFIENGIVPILIDADSDISLISNIVIKYQPNYIFSPSNKSLQFENYLQSEDFKKYTIYKSQQNPIFNLHPDLSLLLSTSGTTGSPKLVRLSYKNLTSNASSIAEYLNLDFSEKAISSLPMNYSFGLSIINSHLHVGGSVVMTNESITQRRFWDIFKEFHVTSLSGVPYTFDILKKFRLLNADLPSLKTITQAGGKLANELIDYFARFSVSKGIKFFVMYGQTEGTARLSYLDPDFVLDKIGSIGKPIPGGEFQIINEQGIVIDRPNVSGELLYTGPNVMLGYAESRNDLSYGDENNGLLRTGDIAQYDIEGFFFIIGRIKRFIKLFGNRVNLDELESLLLEKGIYSACTGKDNYLVVYLLNEDQKDLVKEFLSKNLGIHFSVYNIRVIEEIPKNASGKTLYSKLIVDL